MSDAHNAQIIENGVPPAAQDKVEDIGFKVSPSFCYNFRDLSRFEVFAGNLAYSTTEDGLKTFFAQFDV